MRKKIVTASISETFGLPSISELDASKFRWPVELIEEVALHLALRCVHPPESYSDDGFWNKHIRLAIGCLDARRSSCLRVIEDAMRQEDIQSKVTGIEPVPERLSFVAAVKEITGQTKTSRAIAAFEEYLAMLIRRNDFTWQYSGLPEVGEPFSPEKVQGFAQLWFERFRAAGSMDSFEAHEHFGEYQSWKADTIAVIRSKAGRQKGARQKNHE